MVELFRKLNGTHRNIPKTKRCTFIFLALTHNIATILPDCHRMSSCMFRYVVVWQLFVFRWDCGVVALSYTSESCGFFVNLSVFLYFAVTLAHASFAPPRFHTRSQVSQLFVFIARALRRCVRVEKDKMLFQSMGRPTHLTDFAVGCYARVGTEVGQGGVGDGAGWSQRWARDGLAAFVEVMRNETNIRLRLKI